MRTARSPHPGRSASLSRRSASKTPPGQAVAYTYFRKDENEARQANVLKRALQDIWMAERRTRPSPLCNAFADSYAPKYARAVNV